MSEKQRIVLASGNAHKIREIGQMLPEFEVVGYKELGFDEEIVEDGKTFEHNALIKARACFENAKIPSMGMDDTLYLEGVPEEKQPGLFVRRVNGKTLNDEEMIEHYIGLVKEYGIDGKLNCKWIYGLAVIDENGNESTYTWEKADFYMVDTQSEKINPGYPLNSISKYKNLDKYFTEITEADKDKLKVNEDHVVDFIKNHI